MSTPSSTPAERVGMRLHPQRSIILVSLCTVFGAAAQVLIKFGAVALPHPSIWQMITSGLLIAGYSLYGISAVLMVLALKDGELSLLYPIIALTYVWVTILSVMIFGESMGPFKVAGIGLIILGVAVLGRSGKK